MGLTVQVSCSYHQKNDGGYGREVEIIVDSIDDKNRKHVQTVLEKGGWVVQYNGDNMDTYCSKKCAE